MTIKKRAHIFSFIKDLFITFLISFLIFYAFLSTNFFKFGPWPYGHAGDATENVRTAFFGSFGYLPIKDIAINHMPGVPELLYLGSLLGGFFPHEYFKDPLSLNLFGSYAASICLQVGLSFASFRFFFNRSTSSILSLLLVFYTSFIYYFLPLSESFIPYFIMLWGAIYFSKSGQNQDSKYFNFRIINLISILIIVLWIGLTSPYSVFLLGILTISEIDLRNKKNSIIKNVFSASVPVLISIICFQARYGLLNIYKWNILANASKIDISTYIKNLKEQFFNNFHANIFDNQNISLVIIFVSLYIFLFSKLKIFIKYKKFNQIKDKLSTQKFKYLRKIIFFSSITYICQILDSWRVAGGGFGGSQIYKTEASWGLVIPLCSFLIISVNKLFISPSSANNVKESSDLVISRNKNLVNPIIFSFISYLISILLVSNLLLTPEYFLTEEVGKPPLEGIPKLVNKKEFLQGLRKCGVIDTWDPGAWLVFDIQPCLGVFINSVPKLTDNDPFKIDMLNLIKSEQVVIRGIPEIDKKDTWPVYQRHFANQIICERRDHAFGIICKNKNTYKLD